MERKLALTLCLATGVLLFDGSLGSSANAGVGANAEEFRSGAAFVIAARVLAVRQSEGLPAAYYEADIAPQCCIAGLFDPAAHSIITVESVVDYPLLPPAPKIGDLILAVIYDRTKLQLPQGGFGVANTFCWFMPDNHPLVVVKGMDDPVILDVLKKMQVARQPSTGPATTKE